MNVASSEQVYSNSANVNWPDKLFSGFWVGILAACCVCAAWPQFEVHRTKQLLRDDGVAESWFGRKTHLLQTTEYHVIKPLYVLFAGAVGGLTFAWYRVRGKSVNAPIIVVALILASIGAVWAVRTNARFNDVVSQEFQRVRAEVTDFERWRAQEKDLRRAVETPPEPKP